MQKRIPSELINYLILDTMEKEGATYGYELIKRLQDKSNGHWDPSYGTIYGALNRMEKKDLIERAEKEAEDRKYYRLTGKGERELERRVEDIKELGERSQEMVLGFLNVYGNVYGEKKLATLLDKIKDEFEF